MRIFTISLLLVCIVLCCSSWGFYAHKRINETAVFLLPTEIAGFYKKNIKLITEKAVDADKRCYIDTLEGPRHYIDIDRYGDIDTIPIHWRQAVEKLTERKLLLQGVIPWQIYRSYNNLVSALKEKNINRIIQYSADIGHYIADAHVPLHTTSNYNGQFTNQIGIHAFWETRLPEMFADQYDLYIGAPNYIDAPLEFAWRIVRGSNALVDSVLQLEKNLSQSFKTSEIKSYIERNNQLIFTYSDAYATAYHQILNGMVERRFRNSIHATASIWYSAWVDAGQPNLNHFDKVNTEEKPIDINRKTLGREEWH